VVQFAERLAGLHHEGIESVVFSCSGTEAIEIALGMARTVTGRRGMICTNATYHGNTEFVDSMSYLGDETAAGGESRRFPFPNLYRPLKPGMTEAELCEACLANVERAIDSLNDEGTGFAAILVCSIFANEGMPEFPTDFMPRLTELAHRAGGVVIADEVQAGYVRTGQWWGYDDTGFKPDIVVTGKPMGNGLPLAATAASREIVESFRSHTGYFNTYSSSPLQASVGMAVMDEIERLDLCTSVTKVGGYLKNELKKRVEKHAPIGDVRGRGLFIGVEMITDSASRQPHPDFAARAANRLKEKGFLVATDGMDNNILKVRPPLVFAHEHATEFLAAFDQTMEEIGER
jgi:4-aminobutyrate aminotransferase-like enzyme